MRVYAFMRTHTRRAPEKGRVEMQGKGLLHDHERILFFGCIVTFGGVRYHDRDAGR